MIRKFHINLLLLIAALALIGCRDMGLNGSELFEGVEGQAAETVINFELPAFNATVSRASATEEQQINSLALLVFDQSNQVKSVELFTHVDASKPFKVRAVEGLGMRVVGVANYDAVDGLAQELMQIKDYLGLNALVVTLGVVYDGGLLMVAEARTTIRPNSAIRLQFNYVVAKVNLRVQVSEQFPANESLEITGVELGSIPTAAAMFDGSAAKPIFTDRLPLKVQDDAAQGLSSTFYMFSNRAGGRVSKSPPAGGEVEGAYNAHLFKRHYAPQNASYVVINAMHRTATATRRVELYVYFGFNSSNNYNIGATEQHTYTVVIHGLNKMDVDTNVEYETLTFGASLVNKAPMDAHADSRPLYLHADYGHLDVEVVQGAEWLSVSLLDLQQHQVRQDGNIWQQEGPAQSFVRPKFQRVSTPLDAFSATYSLCRHLVDISMAGEQRAYLHSDENRTGVERTGQIKVTNRLGSGTSQSQILIVRQRAAVALGEGFEMEWAEEYAVESYKQGESDQLKAHNGMQWGYSQTMLATNYERIFNGAFPTANTVYGQGDKFVQPDANGAPTWEASIAYRTKYSSNQGKRDKVAEPYAHATYMPYFLPDYSEEATIYSPVYGSSAARYCHEKNRDMNGDGVLSPEETEWYLPSVAELSHIWVVWNGIAESARPTTNSGGGNGYWSASEMNSSESYALAFASGLAGASTKTTPLRVRCVRRSNGVDTNPIRVENGSAVMDNSSLPVGAVAASVKAMVPASVASNGRVAKRLVVARRDASPKSGLKWHEAAGLPATYEYTSAGDRVATEETGCAAYTEKSDKSDKGTWRLPTARELVRLWSLTLEVNNVGKVTVPANFLFMDGKRYWSASEESNNDAWSVSFQTMPETGKTMPKNFVVHVARGESLSVRCVREIP